ncbi:MAG TPA: hypothetical protein VM865_00240 [Acidobacteriaceae bacterium]|jgi:mono/diheme cytochrome c family protein|nr:hypothetical protein [Acidobacteriaceae bacterium]
MLQGRAFKVWIQTVVAVSVLLAGGALRAQKVAATGPVKLYPARSSPTDLEIGGDLAGMKRGETRFVRYRDLLRLPQRSFTAVGDSNFAGPVPVSGIALADLPILLGAEPEARMVTALSGDRYKANYPPEYLQAHDPILVLRIQGRPPAGWPRSRDGAAMGPYMITHASFTPAFHALAHADEPQVPWGVVRLDFRREAEVFAGIAPTGPAGSGRAVQLGFTIARQNCFRCHNQGAEGGMKSGISWEGMAKAAVANRQRFDRYVTDPRSVNPSTSMPANPAYDATTLAALRAYFRPFAGTPAK